MIGCYVSLAFDHGFDESEDTDTIYGQGHCPNQRGWYDAVSMALHTNVFMVVDSGFGLNALSFHTTAF